MKISNNMKAFLRLTVFLVGVGVALNVGYGHGFKHGYSFGSYDMIKFSNDIIDKAMIRIQKEADEKVKKKCPSNEPVKKKRERKRRTMVASCDIYSVGEKI